jgi:hypothetical protein
MRYPLVKPEEIPGSGSALYLYLLDNIKVPGALPHKVWYDGLTKILEDPSSTPFRGFFPVGETYKIRYGGHAAFESHLFTGDEKNPVFVKDLHTETKLKLGIPGDASEDEKVWNQHYRPYKDVSEDTRKLNELPTLSLAKSISSWFLSNKTPRPYYTEVEVSEMLQIACMSPSSDEMMFLLHGNHLAWCTHSFLYHGIQPDVKKEFYATNSPDFYIKDLGTIMPSVLYALTMLGVDPVTIVENLNYDLWGIDEVAKSLQSDLAINQKKVA